MSDWKTLYHEKLVSVEEAAKIVQSGDRAWFGPVSAAPTELINKICDRVDELENVNLISGLLLYPFKFLQDPAFIGKINFNTIFFGPYERAFFKVGNVNINSVHFSNLHLAVGEMKPNVLLADVSIPDEDGYMYYGPMGVSLNGVVAEMDSMERIIVQVNKHQPKVDGFKHRIHVSEVDCICEHDAVLPELPNPEVSDTDKKISELVLQQIPNGATVQIGLGGLSNAVGYGLESKSDLSVYTEMFTDSMTYLAKKGVITGEMIAGFGLGNKETYDFISTGRVKLVPLYETNTPSKIAKHDNFISINSCLMADLTGQISSESIGFRQYSSTGGALDFVRGAAMSNGGKSFLCLPSTTTSKDGEVSSTINVSLPQGGVVTIPRTDVMYVVTEFGVANVYNKSMSERVEAMISIAHPDFREQLREDAIKVGFIRG